MKQSGSRFRGSLCFCGMKEFAEKTPTAMLRRTLRMQKSGRRAREHTRDELPPPKIPCEERSKKTCTQNAARTGGRAKENSPAEVKCPPKVRQRIRIKIDQATERACCL